ncbi:MAG TPA: YfiR family protein [Bacteroidia bacterium]|nr:YfiR family protein [Bacteroidia bacterium]
MRKTYLLFAFLLLPFANAFGQQFEQLAAHTKVIYIVNFIKYIEWPPDYRSGDFVIGVLNGSPAMLEELNKMAATKTAGSQKFVIKNFKSIEEIDKCNILYIPEGSNGLLAEVTKKVHGKSTLLITETEGDARKGAAINFIAKDNKQAFELNKAMAEKSGLVVSSGLKALAAVNIE